MMGNTYLLLEISGTLAVTLEYIIYAAILVIGIIVLAVNKKKKKKPTSVKSVEKTTEAIARIDRILADERMKKNLSLMLPTWVMQVDGDVGDLVVLADRELTDNRDVTYEDVYRYYSNASHIISEIDLSSTLEPAEARKLFLDVRAELQKALDLLNDMSKAKKK